jgi:hypothetical protein
MIDEQRCSINNHPHDFRIEVLEKAGPDESFRQAAESLHDYEALETC